MQIASMPTLTGPAIYVSVVKNLPLYLDQMKSPAPTTELHDISDAKVQVINLLLLRISKSISEY